MIWLVIAIGAVLLLWIISLLIQKRDKKSREKVVQQHIEEKEKEEEQESRSPFGDS